MAADWRLAGMSGPERVWHAQLCRALNVTVGGPILDTKEARDAANELLEVLANPSKYASQEEWEREQERIGGVVRQHQRRTEDKHAAGSGFPAAGLIMGVRFREPVPRDHADRLRGFVDEALVELDACLDVPVSVVDRYGAFGPANPRTPAWVTRLGGVFLCRDQLDLDDDVLRGLMFEETCHVWHLKMYPVRSTLCAELFATWFVARTCRTVVVRKHLDPADRYGLGRHAGAALAGHAGAREELVAVGADVLLGMVDRLDGDARPQELAAQLAESAGAL